MRRSVRYVVAGVVAVGIAAGAFWLGRTMPARYVVDSRCQVLNISPKLQRVVLYWSDGSISFAPFFKIERPDPTSSSVVMKIVPGDGTDGYDASWLCDPIGVDKYP